MASANGSIRAPNQGLVSYDLKPSPRGQNEIDVRSYIEQLVEYLQRTKQDLKDYKKTIEIYRSDIAAM